MLTVHIGYRSAARTTGWWSVGLYNDAKWRYWWWNTSECSSRNRPEWSAAGMGWCASAGHVTSSSHELTFCLSPVRLWCESSMRPTHSNKDQCTSPSGISLDILGKRRNSVRIKPFFFFERTLWSPLCSFYQHCWQHLPHRLNFHNTAASWITMVPRYTEHGARLSFVWCWNKQNLIWQELIFVDFNNGYYTTQIGANPTNPIDIAKLSTYPLFLEIEVDNTGPLTPRQS